MKTIFLKSLLIVSVIAMAACAAQQASQWKVHDMERPKPTIIRPGATNADPPSDAIVLFDGTGLSQWQSVKNGGDAKWKVQNGYMEVVPKTGAIQTREGFGSCQLHIEWRTPDVIKGNGQGRGNSGVFLMGKYEVQVLDSFQKEMDHYDNPTYADGQAGALYGQKPPDFNVSRKPGQWQTYDIKFHAPVFDGDKVVKPATVSVLHNGVWIQDNWTIQGTTFHKKTAAYEPHAARLPLQLQDHGNPMRFRNIWIRPLND